MDSHHVGRNRKSVEEALREITARTLVVGIDSDILFPVDEQKFLADHIKDANFRKITSRYGHDGFLVEFDQLNEILTTFYKNILSEKLQ
jgi:homoserine O-acetyltransferase